MATSVVVPEEEESKDEAEVKTEPKVEEAKIEEAKIEEVKIDDVKIEDVKITGAQAEKRVDDPKPTEETAPKREIEVIEFGKPAPTL